jgi:hypothetical protein
MNNRDKLFHLIMANPSLANEIDYENEKYREKYYRKLISYMDDEQVIEELENYE